MSFKRIKTFSFNFQENGQERKRKENTKYYYITNFELKSNLENVISLLFLLFYVLRNFFGIDLSLSELMKAQRNSVIAKN